MSERKPGNLGADGTTPLFLKANKKEGLFSLPIGIPGEYKIEFYNANFIGAESITLGQDVTRLGNDTDTRFGHDLSNNTVAEHGMKLTEQALMDLLVEEKFFEIRQWNQRTAYLSLGNKAVYLAIAETIIVIALSLWQVYYIKKLLDFRQSV